MEKGAGTTAQRLSRAGTSSGGGSARAGSLGGGAKAKAPSAGAGSEPGAAARAARAAHVAHGESDVETDESDESDELDAGPGALEIEIEGGDGLAEGAGAGAGAGAGVGAGAGGALPPLPAHEGAQCSDSATALHLFISMVGAGMLGLPFAFSRVGLLGALCVLPPVGAVSSYALTLLVESKRALQARGKAVKGYGDIAFFASGRLGAAAVDALLVLAQVSFGCAYLLFIGANVHAVFPLALSPHAVIALCAAPLGALALVRNLHALSRFTVVADMANLTGILVVLGTDLAVLLGRGRAGAMPGTAPAPHGALNAGLALGQVPYFFSVALYCFEGVGTVLPIEEAMANKPNFERVLLLTTLFVTAIYSAVGALGYLAYGDATLEIVTLNLGDTAIGDLVKLSLSVGLLFTFPLTIFPVLGLLEQTQCVRRRGNGVRVGLVLLCCAIALGIPNFHDFLAFAGALTCSLLGLVLPALCHLRLVRNLSLARKALDCALVAGGALFCVLGTASAVADMAAARQPERTP